MKKTITNVVRYALVSLFSFLFIGSALADAPTPSVVWYGANAKEAFEWGAKSGYTLSRDRVSTAEHQIAADGSKITIVDDGAYGVQIRPSANYNAFSVLVKYSNFTPNSNGDTVIATARNPSAGNRIGFYVNSDGTKMRSIIGNVLNGSTGEVDNAFPENGEFCFIYDKGASTIKVYARAAGDDDFAQIFSFTDNNSNKDTITIAGVRENNQAGAHNVSGGTACNPVGMEIEGIALFDGSVLSTSEVGSYVWPEGRPVINATITAESVKVSDINGLSELAEAISDDIVKLTLVGTKTLEFDEAFKCEECKIILDGDLLLDSATEPADIAKFDFKGVTGQIARKWLIKDLPVGTGMAINFNQGQGKLGDSDEAGIPGLTIYGNVWNNTDGGSGSLATAKMFAPDGETMIADTMSVSWTGDLYQWTNATTGFLKGYLDDSNITFSTIVPFDRYDVYIICATDTPNAQFGYKKINGVNYSANANGDAVANSTAAWGASQQLTPILGKNVMHLEGLTAQNFAITESPKGNGRGCIAAIVIVKSAPPAAAVTATISADTDWSAIQWSGTPADNTPLELTITDSVTVKLDTDVVAKNIKLIGNKAAEQVIGIEGTADKINAFLGKVTATVDFAGKFNYCFDATSGLTADSALLNMITNAGNDKIFTFTGSGENGVTFGSSSSTWNGTLNTHIVLNGGKHTIYWSNSNVLFGAGASVDSPTLLLENNATLDFYGHDISGWSASADNDNARLAGVIRINNGSTLNMHRQGSGTVYYNQTFCIEGGAKITTDIDGTDARMGGAKIVVPAQDTVGSPAEIVCTSSGSGSLFFGKDIPKGVEFSIGTNAKLKITGAVESLNSSNDRVAGGGDYPLKKTGDGVLEVTDNILAPVNVNGGSIALGGTAKSITFADDATLTSLNAISLKDFSVADGKTLTLDATAGDIAITKAPTNNGTIKIVGGNVAFMPDTNVGTIIEEGGKAIYGYIVNINDCGKFTIPEGKTAETIRLFDAAGNAIPFTDNHDGTVSYEWVVTGGVCWWDYEFEGNGNNDGTDGTALNWDNDRPRKGAEYTADGELYISASPWRGGVNWPAKATFVMYGTMVGTDKTYQIGFGSTYQGQAPYNTIFLATDTVSENTVNLCICQAKNAPTVLCQMTVPNAQTAKHLYAFTLKTVDSKTVVDIYLDGELLQSYPFDSQIVLGAGFQIGSGHGGTCTGYDRAVAADEAVLDFLRVYTEEFTSETHTKYAVKYPYVSPNGSYQRTVTTDADWSATDAWTKEGTDPVEFADEPVANATVKLAIDNAETTTVAINLADDVAYEAIQINGDDVKFVLAEGEDFGGIAKSAGRVTANANITFAYDAFSMAGAPLTVKQGKTVTFDLSMVDMTQFFSTQTYDLTGYLTLEEGAGVNFIVPAELHGREASAAIDPTTKHYVLTVTAPDYQFVYENGKWTWGTQTVDEEIMNANPSIVRLIKSDLTMALGSYNYTVDDGATLKPADSNTTGTITVDAGGTFDINGKNDTALTVVLNGGSLVNTGDGVPVGKKQYVSISQTANSTIGGVNELAYVNSGYAANTLDLGDATLSKINDNTFTLCNTTVQNGALEIAGGKIVANRAVTFDETATLTIGSDGALEIATGNSDTLTIGAITSYEGAILNNAGTITDFTLTGAITLAGVGTFGTITLDDAELDLAKVRGLTIDGAGSIKATITAAEMAAGEVIVFTKAEDAEFYPITLVDEVGEELSGYTADYDEEGNYIAYFSVEVAIPEIAGTTVEVWVTGSEEAIEPIEGKVMIPYGADMTVLYIAEAGKLFKKGDYMLPLEYENVTVDPEIANNITEDDVTVDAGARIEDVDYLDIPAALADATDGDTVIVLQNAALDSLTVPTGVTLDLNEKTVLINPANITNNGMIVIYDAATAMALIDTHGKIKFGELVTIDIGYQFPAGTTITIVKRSAPGATESLVELPQNSILINLVGAAAKKVINVYPENPQNGALLLAGTIERGSHDVDTIINVGGYTLVGAPLIIGEDGEGMDYETYPDNKAKLISTFIQFNDEMVSEIVGYPVQGCIQLIPGVGVVQTATDLSGFIGTRFVTLTGAEIKDSFDGTIHTYTAEWIKPEATVEAMTDKPEELAAAATFKATEAGAQKYADYTASLTITSDKNVAQDAIILAGQFNATNLEDPAGINNNYDGEWIDMPLTSDLTANEPYAVIDMPWNYIAENVKTFNCGLKNIALTEETTFTVTLTIAKDDDTVLTKNIEFTIPAAKVLPTASVTSTTAEGYEAAVEFTAGNIGVGYDSWIAKFYLISDVTIGEGEVQLGGNYGSYGWVDKDYTCTAGDPVSVLAAVGLDDDITVKTVFEAIQSFKCGVKNIALKNDATFTLKLVITDGETTKEICSIDDLTVKAKSSPVVPGEDIDIPSGKDPQEYAGEVEAQKATLLKAPVELVGEALTTYQGYFTAQVVGDNKVAFVLNEDGEEAVEEAVKAAEANVLSVALSADTTELTIADPLKGFYYSLKQGGELTNLGFNEEGDKNKLAGKDEVKFTLTKPEGKGFYQTIVTPVEYK